jgi:hypothetical protein
MSSSPSSSNARKLRSFLNALWSVPVASTVVAVEGLWDFFFKKPLKGIKQALDAVPGLKQIEAWIGRQPPKIALACVFASLLVLLPMTALEVLCLASGKTAVAVFLMLAKKGIGPVLFGRTWKAAEKQCRQIAWVDKTATACEKAAAWAHARIKAVDQYLAAYPLYGRTKALVRASAKRVKAGLVRAKETTMAVGRFLVRWVKRRFAARSAAASVDGPVDTTMAPTKPASSVVSTSATPAVQPAAQPTASRSVAATGAPSRPNRTASPQSPLPK